MAREDWAPLALVLAVACVSVTCIKPMVLNEPVDATTLVAVDPLLPEEVGQARKKTVKCAR